MRILLLNCYFVDINGLVDSFLHNSINMFIPLSFSYNSIFFYEDSISFSNIMDQFYFSQNRILYE